MVPGWSERDRQSHNAMRRDWIRAAERDGPALGARVGPPWDTARLASPTAIVRRWLVTGGRRLAGGDARSGSPARFWIPNRIMRGESR